MYLLSPRVLIALALVALLTFTHWKAFQSGKILIRAEWTAATAAANSQAREVESGRHERVAVAAQSAASRQRRIAVDHSGLRSELDGMRNAADAAERVAKESTAAANQYRAACTALLKEGGGLLAEVARAADQHSSDVTLLLEAWPKD